MTRFCFDPASGRLYQRLHGFLSVADAEAVRQQVTQACERVRQAGLLMSVLVNLRDYPAQSQAVNDVVARIAATVAATPRRGYAVVTGSALQRLRLRRVMDAIGPDFFDSAPAAAAHLGWEPAFLATVSSP